MLAGLSRFRATAFLVKTIYATPPIIVEELAEQLEISRFQLVDLRSGENVRFCQSQPEHQARGGGIHL
jgi:hypothetical protein